MTDAVWCHHHISEREFRHVWPDGRVDDASWEDCLWCSVTEWLNDTWENVPDTHGYAEKLRAASGEPPAGGSNFDNVRTAFHRLGIPVPVSPTTVNVLLKGLKPGSAGVATGNMANFPWGHRLRRFDPRFAAGHAWYVARLLNGKLVRCDPLAPDGSYEGEPITEGELRTFMGSVWTGVFRPIRKPLPDTSTGDDMYEPFGAPQQPSNATAKRATKLYSQADKATGVLSGVSYNIPAGHVKRYAGPLTAAIAVVVHDRDSSVEGKSHLYGKAVDWEVKPNP